MVLTADGFSNVDIITHNDPNQIAEYITLTTDSNNTITLSDKHYIYANNNYKFAENVQIGDTLQLYGHKNVKVIDITKNLYKGVYAPITKTGNIIVNGIHASCYAYTKSHQIAHSLFNPILNMTPKHLKIKTSEPGEVHPINTSFRTLAINLSSLLGEFVC